MLKTLKKQKKSIENVSVRKGKSITCNEEHEFWNWCNIEEMLKFDVYFADPYCAWQKTKTETDLFEKSQSLPRWR